MKLKCEGERVNVTKTKEEGRGKERKKEKIHKDRKNSEEE